MLMEDFNDMTAKIEAALGEKVHVVTGTYRGNGATSQFIQLPATPQALIVALDGRLGSGNITYGGIVTPTIPNEAVVIGENGFTVYGNGGGSGSRPMANSTSTYAYFAFYWTE